ncbi:hypothetical protein AB1N83_005122 [Pleurotus pulmonarius]
MFGLLDFNGGDGVLNLQPTPPYEWPAANDLCGLQTPPPISDLPTLQDLSNVYVLKHDLFLATSRHPNDTLGKLVLLEHKMCRSRLEEQAAPAEPAGIDLALAKIQATLNQIQATQTAMEQTQNTMQQTLIQLQQDQNAMQQHQNAMQQDQDAMQQTQNAMLQTLIQLQQGQNAMLQDQAAIRQSLQSLTTEIRQNYAATAKP